MEQQDFRLFHLFLNNALNMTTHNYLYLFVPVFIYSIVIIVSTINLSPMKKLI